MSPIGAADPFTADAPDRLWVADATRIPCGQGAFWLAAVRDAFSNRIVGWKTSDRCDTDLALGALEYGIWSRQVRQGQLVHHSDRGSTYTSFRFGQTLTDHGVLASMGSVGDSYDNALMENFFSTLKTELAYRTTWRTREQAENALFTYIDGWYNTRRIQKREVPPLRRRFLSWSDGRGEERLCQHRRSTPMSCVPVRCFCIGSRIRSRWS